MSNKQVNIFWFRRDLRLTDNKALYHALSNNKPVLPVFLFDTNITDLLPHDDHRITFIYNTLLNINQELTKAGSSILIIKGEPVQVFNDLISQYSISEVYFNDDYEPYAIKRDNEITKLLEQHKIFVNRYNDHLIFSPGSVLKDNGDIYKVYTPFMRRWKSLFDRDLTNQFKSEELLNNFVKKRFGIPTLKRIGFSERVFNIPGFRLDDDTLQQYEQSRNRPDMDKTTKLSPHLRFGTVSIRHVVSRAILKSEFFLNELIWREFFAHILYFYPKVETENFKKGLDLFPWQNNIEYINRWMAGTTGVPLVDAGIRQLLETGIMHNRVRMVAASFLVKHLLTDWRIGEAFFAKHLTDYELSSNNGNWQWVAGTGSDASPFFRIFNPYIQQKRFDPEMIYIKRWVKEVGTSAYPHPIVDHKEARVLVLDALKNHNRKKGYL